MALINSTQLLYPYIFLAFVRKREQFNNEKKRFNEDLKYKNMKKFIFTTFKSFMKISGT
jgi:hypothetical protein